jgi:hypothetical protein
MIEKASFFRLRYEELRKDSKHAAFSGSEFKQLLEAEYRQALANEEAERQAQTLAKARAEAERQAQTLAKARAEAERQVLAKAEEREASERWVRELYGRKARARADFDALGKEMAQATNRVEPVELGRKRAKYENVCWYCLDSISSTIQTRCSVCGWYICSNCGSCKRDCNKTYMSVVHDEAVDPFLPDFPDD